MMMQGANVTLQVIQQPQRAQAVPENAKNRKPIDPPPMVQMIYDPRNDQANKEWLVSPRCFMFVELYKVDEDEQVKYLCGNVTSSLHKLKDTDSDKDGGYFIFGDISVKKIGTYKLRFYMYDTSPCTGSNSEDSCTAELLQQVDSEPFEVKNVREFGSMGESTERTKAFAEQGVKLRVRKANANGSVAVRMRSELYDSKSLPRKRSHESAELSPGNASGYGYNPQHYPSKRPRSQSDYNVSHTNSHYAYHSMPPGSGLPDATVGYHAPVRSGVSSGQTLVGAHSRTQSYNQFMRSMPNYTATSTQSWQNVPSAQPSPTGSSSVGPPQASPSYASIPAQSSTPSNYSSDHNNLASSVSMRAGTSNYYNDYSAYQNSVPYQPQSSSDAHQPYPDLQMPGTSLGDTSAITAQDHNYAASYNFMPNEMASGYQVRLI